MPALALARASLATPKASSTLATEATAFAAAIQTAIDTSTTEFTATASGGTLSLTGKDLLFAVIPTVTNGNLTTAASYERWYEVTGSDTGTDQLVNIEQVVFSDAATDLSFKTSKTAAWGATGLEVSTLYTGTALSDLMVSTAANEVFVGMSGSDHFVIPDAAGIDTIKDFLTGAGGDVLTLLLGIGDTDGLNGTGVDTVTEALAKGSQQGADTVFDFGAGNTVRLVGVSLGDLTADNFEVMPSF